MADYKKRSKVSATKGGSAVKGRATKGGSAAKVGAPKGRATQGDVMEAREFDRCVSARCPEEQQAAFIAQQIGRCADAIGKRPCDVGWWDFRAYGKIAWGQSRIGIAHRLISALGGFKTIRDAYFAREATDLAVTRMRAREHAALNRRLGHAAADVDFQFRQIQAFASRIFKGRIKPVVPPAYGAGKMTKAVAGLRSSATKDLGPIKRELVVCLGDWHLGSDIQAEETGAENFGPLQEARRAAKIVQQVCTYKPEHRHETALRVVLLGDFIHGCLHDLKDGAVLAEQKSRAMHLLIQVITHFSAAFRKVTVEAVTGNHGRDKMRHPKHATSGKWDSHEMLIYSAVHYACSNLKNVEWHLPKSAFGVFTLFGKRYFYTHGETVIKATENGKELEAQINALNASLRDRDEYVVVLLAHLHRFRRFLLNNGVTAIINGPFTPIDAYAVSIGVVESVSSQLIFETTADYPFGDSRLITLDKSVDEDTSLDSLVKMWRGF